MRKLTFIFIVVTFAVSANAGTVDLFVSAVNGQPITLTKEITISVGDTFSIEIDYNDPFRWFFSLGADVYVDTGSVKFDDNAITWNPLICEGCIYFPEFPPCTSLVLPPDNNCMELSTTLCGFDSTTGGIFIVRSILVFDNNFIGDYHIKMLNNTNLPSGGTFEFDGGDIYVPDFGTGIIVHVVYHPACWDCPEQKYGDTNGDGKVSSMDYFNFKKSYGTGFNTHPHGTGVGEYNCCCDFNHDGRVSASDYFPIRAYYGLMGSPCSDISCQ